MRKLLKYLTVLILSITLLCLLVLVLSGGLSSVNDPSLEQSPAPALTQTPRTNTQPHPENNLYFGDLHIHTSYSSDAFVMGVRTLPRDAYHFTRGGTIDHGAGYQIRLKKPLDFAAVTDHSEYLGMMRESNPNVPLTHNNLKDILQNKTRLEITIDYLKTTLRIANQMFTPEVINDDFSNAAWQATIDTAEEFYSPGEFTTFIAYEWSSQPNRSNLHRNIIYRGGRSQVPDTLFSSIDSENPFDLLREMKRQNEEGFTVLSIPHNGNLSNGLMYGRNDMYGEAMTAEFAELRSRYEPIHEILQVKGSSDTHPALSPEDEFADFEIFASNMSAFKKVGAPNGSYARDALRTGMELSHSEGFNPYQFGVIGSSDGHNSSSPIEEDSFHGKLPMMDGAASIRMNTALLLPNDQNRATQWGSGGLAAVWAPENTREALFDAMMRKETFATSGPRMAVRFFASWQFDQSLLQESNIVKTAYQLGVPMGGKLLANKQDTTTAPSFYISALKDPDGANLDRIQIIKLWLDKQGKSQEKVFDIVGSDNRQLNEAGKLPPVGSTVDIANASYENSIGATSLEAVWQDPEFDSSAQASYYVRVLEIPTPRWSTYDAKLLGIPPVSPATIQERAITSAIWYEPQQVRTNIN